MSTFENPYASPQAPIEPPNVESVELGYEEKVRRDYINHEASVRSLSTLYFLGAIVPVGACFGFANDGQPVPAIVAAVIASLIISLGIAVRKLQPWTRWPIGICALLGLVVVPVGTIISAYILYLVFGRKGRYVYSRQYANIVLQTPHVIYRTPLALKWVAILLIIAVLSVLTLPTLLHRR